MSLKYLAIRLYKNGRLWYKNRLSYRAAIKITEESSSNKSSKTVLAVRQVEASRLIADSIVRNVGVSLTQEARKYFIDNVLCKVSLHVNPALRDLVKRRLFFGDAGPLFALVGVSLAAGGRLSKEEELDGICWEIRNAVSRFQWVLIREDVNEQVFVQDQITLKNLEIGNAIAKGCSAVVYAAKINNKTLECVPTQVHNAPIEEDIIDKKIDNAVNEDNFLEYPLALKMMFNYDIRSSSSSILKAMYQETVPARRFYSDGEIAILESLFSRSKVTLPPHSNVVTMYSVFADYMPQLSDSMKLYPSALPAAYNPDGYGRNMTLFLLMKKYRHSLQSYIRNNEVTQRESTLLFAQLLEGITHININGIAHRDLKSDNILIDTDSVDKNSVPILVITDFGCCLANSTHGLRIPFRTEEIDRGGNVALMAPEIITTSPGAFSYLDYRKSDLWAAGTIAYEIYGLKNPFWTHNKKTEKNATLRNAYYKDEELPSMENKPPTIIGHLIKNILSKNPKTRLNVEVAADVCQLFLWAPSRWIREKRMPATQEILEWLLCLTTKILCEGRLTTESNQRPGKSNQVNQDETMFPEEGATSHSKRRTHAEYLLIANFLSRVNIFNVKSALAFIHTHA